MGWSSPCLQVPVCLALLVAACQLWWGHPRGSDFWGFQQVKTPGSLGFLCFFFVFSLFFLCFFCFFQRCFIVDTFAPVFFFKGFFLWVTFWPSNGARSLQTRGWPSWDPPNMACPVFPLRKTRDPKAAVRDPAKDFLQAKQHSIPSKDQEIAREGIQNHHENPWNHHENPWNTRNPPQLFHFGFRDAFRQWRGKEFEEFVPLWSDIGNDWGGSFGSFLREAFGRFWIDVFKGFWEVIVGGLWTFFSSLRFKWSFLDVSWIFLNECQGVPGKATGRRTRNCQEARVRDKGNTKTYKKTPLKIKKNQQNG